MSLYEEVKKTPEVEPEPAPEAPKKKMFRDGWEVKYLTNCWKCGSDYSKKFMRCPECSTKNKKYLPRPMEVST